MIIVSIMAGFAFGYCVLDIISTRRAQKQLDEILKDAIERETNENS